MTLKRFLLMMMLCLLAIVGLPGGLPKPALACAPGEPSGLSQNFRDSGIVSRARVQEVDAFGQNAIVRVEQYYKGTGPEHVLISLNDPATISDLLNEQPFTSCTNWYPPLSEGDTVVFLANRNFDGSYFIGGNFVQKRFAYSSADQTLDVREDGETSSRKYTLAQLVARLTQLGGKATTPTPDFRPVLRAPIRIITKNGTRYLLPIDGGKLESIESYFDELAKESAHEDFTRIQRARYDGVGKDHCVGLSCIAYSPNGTSQYNFSICSYKSAHDAAVFSALGTHATWREQKIFAGCDTLIADLNTDDDKSAEKLALYAQWSPDGRKLAYNDLKGLWVWEMGKKENNPRLIFPAGKTPVYARYFSPRGSYLAVSEGEKNYTLNLDTGATFYDGVFSPTEEYFIAFGTRDKTTGLFPVILCHNGTFNIREFMCRTSDFGNPSAQFSTNPDKPKDCCYDVPDVRQVEWTGDYRFHMLIRPDVNDKGPNGSEEVTPSPTPLPPWDTRNGYILVDFIATGDYSVMETFKYARFVPNAYTKGFSFVYDRPNRSLALLKDDTTIMINDRALKFTIGKDIDSPIVQIDWLPSLMYWDRAH
jgi:hypothetical protein